MKVSNIDDHIYGVITFMLAVCTIIGFIDHDPAVVGLSFLLIAFISWIRIITKP